MDKNGVVHWLVTPASLQQRLVNHAPLQSTAVASESWVKRRHLFITISTIFFMNSNISTRHEHLKIINIITKPALTILLPEILLVAFVTYQKRS